MMMMPEQRTRSCKRTHPAIHLCIILQTHLQNSSIDVSVSIHNRFAKGGDRAVFERFWTTNSVPTVTEQLPEDDAFTVLDLMDKIVYDLDFH